MGKVVRMPARFVRREMESEVDAARRRVLVAQMNDALRVRMVRTRLDLVRGIEAMRSDFCAARSNGGLFGKLKSFLTAGTGRK